jgi:chemotaxis protein methyltransferase CheR
MEDFLDKEVSIKDLKIITQCLKDNGGYDFTNYAHSSLKRRLSRNYVLFKINTVEELVLKLKTDKQFLEKYVEEITVNTTEMFRDPTFWRFFKESILPKYANQPKLKIWHAACSSGEEVTSMCILLKEEGYFDKTTIYATDLNEHVIENAKSLKYPSFNLETNMSNYIKFGGKKNFADYYSTADNYTTQFDKELLKNVTFQKQNLITYTPTTKFDIIICRNVFIYFNLDLQDNILTKYNDSLFSGGYLALGSKESIAWCKSANVFNLVSPEEKVYQKQF